MSEPKSLRDLLDGRADAAFKQRAETAEKLGRQAEVELLEARRRVRWLEEELGLAQVMLREAGTSLLEIINERDELQRRNSQLMQFTVIR